MVKKRFSYLAIATIILLSLIFFNEVILSPNSIISSNASDIPSFVYPSFIFTKEAFKFGIPLWNPLIFGGYSWVANSHSDLFYPTIILNLLLPSHLAINYSIILQLIITGILMYFYLRELNLPEGFSLFGALTFIFSGHVITRIYAGHLAIINALLWIPLLFLLIEKFIKIRKFYLVILIGLALGLQYLGSHPQIFIYNVIVVFFYLSFRLLYEKRDVISLLKNSSIIILVALGVSAIELIPVYEFSNFFDRRGGFPYDELIGMSLPPLQLISLALPEFFGTQLDYTRWGARHFWELTGYAGVLPIILSLIALFIKRNKFVLFFAALAIFSIIYAFGGYTPLFNLIQHIPVLNFFRGPSRFLLFFVFSVSVMSSIGLEALFANFKKNKPWRNLFLLISISSLIIILLSLLLKQNILDFAKLLAEQRLETEASFDPLSSTVKNLLETKGIEYFTEKIFNHIISNILVVTISLAGLYVIYLLVERKILKSNFAIIFIIGLLIFDLWTFGAKYISIKELNYEDLLQVPNETWTYRVLTPEGSFYDNIELNRRFIQRFDGYDPSMLKHYTDVFKFNAQKGIQEIANVKFIYRGMYPNGTLTILNETLPRAFVVHGYKLSELDNHLEIMEKPDFNPRLILPLDKKLIKIDDIEIVNFTSYTPNMVELQINTNESGYLILLDTWYPGWEAFVNDNPVTVMRAYHMMRAIEIPYGNNRIDFVFNPLSFRIGSFITIFTILIISLILLPKFTGLYYMKDISKKLYKTLKY